MQEETIENWVSQGFTEIYDVLRAVDVVTPQGRFRYEALSDLRRSWVSVRCYKESEDGAWLRHRVPDVREQDAESAIRKAIALQNVWGP